MSQNPQPAARKQSALVKVKYDLLQEFDMNLISDITIILDSWQQLASSDFLWSFSHFTLAKSI